MKKYRLLGALLAGVLAVTGIPAVTQPLTVSVSAAAKLAAPKNIKAVSSGTSAIKLTWSKVSGASAYRVYKYNASTKKYETYKNVAGTSCTVKNLESGKTYKFRVAALVKSGGKYVVQTKSSAVSATVTEVIFTYIGGLLFTASVEMKSCMIGVCLGLVFLLLYYFFVYSLDYSRVERVQFEDEEYYYYVKAVPKRSLPKQNKNIKTIHKRQEEKEEKEEEPEETGRDRIVIEPVPIETVSAENPAMPEVKLTDTRKLTAAPLLLSEGEEDEKERSNGADQRLD